MNFDLILKNIHKHIELDQAETDYFLSLLKTVQFKRKDFLLKAGEVCRYEYFILKGCFRTYTIDESGKEHIVRFGIEDWWIGDPYSFLTGQPSDYFIDALEDSEIVRISNSQMEELYKAVPKFERFFRILFQNAFIAQQYRIKQNLSDRAEERYLDFIRRYPNIEQRVSQKHVASFLGVTPVFLSVLRKKFSKS